MESLRLTYTNFYAYKGWTFEWKKTGLLALGPAKKTWS